MIDLHSHVLPGLCDGSQDLETSLEMARIAVADGITHLACTPHIYPGVYNNSTSTIAPAIKYLQAELDRREIPLKLVMGADVHMTPEVIRGLKQGTIPTLNGSRYFLLEPAHHVPVLNFLDQIHNLLIAGYIPVITHPERLHWIDKAYEQFLEAARMGAWLQVTASAISGHFGQRAAHWAKCLLQDGYVHILASDAHGTHQRPPILSTGIKAALRILDNEDEIMRMVIERPRAILNNIPPEALRLPPALLPDTSSPDPHSPSMARAKSSKKNWLTALFR